MRYRLEKTKEVVEKSITKWYLLNMHETLTSYQNSRSAFGKHTHVLVQELIHKPFEAKSFNKWKQVLSLGGNVRLKPIFDEAWRSARPDEEIPTKPTSVELAVIYGIDTRAVEELRLRTQEALQDEKRSAAQLLEEQTLRYENKKLKEANQHLAGRLADVEQQKQALFASHMALLQSMQGTSSDNTPSTGADIYNEDYPFTEAF